MGDISNELPRDAANEILSLESAGVTSTPKTVQTSGASSPRDTALKLSNSKVVALSLNIENTPSASSALTGLLRRNSQGDIEQVDGSGLGAGGSIIPQTYNKGTTNTNYDIDGSVESGREFEFMLENNSVATVSFDNMPDGWWCILSLSDGALELTSIGGGINFVDGKFDTISNPSWENNTTLFLTYKEDGNRMRIVTWE